MRMSRGWLLLVFLSVGCSSDTADEDRLTSVRCIVRGIDQILDDKSDPLNHNYGPIPDKEEWTFEFGLRERSPSSGIPLDLIQVYQKGWGKWRKKSTTALDERGDLVIELGGTFTWDFGVFSLLIRSENIDVFLVSDEPPGPNQALADSSVDPFFRRVLFDFQALIDLGVDREGSIHLRDGGTGDFEFLVQELGHAPDHSMIQSWGVCSPSPTEAG